MFHRSSLFHEPPVTVTSDVTFGEAGAVVLSLTGTGTVSSVTGVESEAGVAAGTTGAGQPSTEVPLVRKSTALELPDMVSCRPNPLK